MRFRLATGPQGSRQIAESFGHGMDTLFQAPLLAAQGAEEAQNAQMKRDLMSSEMAQQQAHAALFGQQADALRTQQERGGMGELLKTAALQNGVPLAQLPEATDYFQTGHLAGKYQLPADQQGPILPAPQYADPALGARIMQTLGLSRQALTLGDGNVEHLTKASGDLQKQGDVRAVQSNPNSAGVVGQSYAAVDGKPLIQNIGNTGEGFNQYTGQGGTLDSGLRVLYGDVQGANIKRDNAAAAASYASASERAAQTRKINQDIEQGQKTGNLQVVTGPNGEVTIVDKVNRTAAPVLDANGRPVVKGAAGGGGKPLTDSQAKANLFGARMLESGKILSDLEDQGVTRPGTIKSVAEGAGRIIGLGTSAGDALADAAGAATNFTQSPQQQQVEQARRDFVNAVLRRESGAAISPSEFSNAEKQYFPQPGDSPKVREQKRRNRQIAANLMLQEVPEASRYRLGGSAAPAPAAPAAPLAQTGGASGSWGDPTVATGGGGWGIQRIN